MWGEDGTRGLNEQYIHTRTRIHRTRFGTAAGSGCKVNIYAEYRSPDKSKRSSNTKRAHLGLGPLPAL